MRKTSIAAATLIALGAPALARADALFDQLQADSGLSTEYRSPAASSAGSSAGGRERRIERGDHSKAQRHGTERSPAQRAIPDPYAEPF